MKSHKRPVIQYEEDFFEQEDTIYVKEDDYEMTEEQHIMDEEMIISTLKRDFLDHAAVKRHP
jgi:hypothetical protein